MGKEPITTKLATHKNAALHLYRLDSVGEHAFAREVWEDLLEKNYEGGLKAFNENISQLVISPEFIAEPLTQDGNLLYMVGPSWTTISGFLYVQSFDSVNEFLTERIPSFAGDADKINNEPLLIFGTGPIAEVSVQLTLPTAAPESLNGSLVELSKQLPYGLTVINHHNIKEDNLDSFFSEQGFERFKAPPATEYYGFRKRDWKSFKG